MPAPPELSTALRAAQRAFNRGDAQAALARLEALPPAHHTTAVLRLQGLCLQLLNRAQQAQHLAAAATARYPNHPFRLLQTADLAWYRHDHWPALLAYLNALQQQPRLHNLWPRIFKIASALTASPPPGADAAPYQAQLRQLLIALAEQLPAQSTAPSSSGAWPTCYRCSPPIQPKPRRSWPAMALRPSRPWTPWSRLPDRLLQGPFALLSCRRVLDSVLWQLMHSRSW